MDNNLAEEPKGTAAETKDVRADEKPLDAEELRKEVDKLKEALSRANSTAADWKRQLREKQTEQEKAEADRKEYEAKREARIAELEAKERISTYKNKLLEASVDPASADIMANALPEGVSDDYFATLKSYLSTQRQEIETAKLNNKPTLSVGMPPSGSSRTEEDIKLDKIFGLTH